MLHQTVEDESRFAQTTENGLLIQAHRVLARLGVERDAAAVHEMTEVSGFRKRRQRLTSRAEYQLMMLGPAKKESAIE